MHLDDFVRILVRSDGLRGRGKLELLDAEFLQGNAVVHEPVGGGGVVSVLAGSFHGGQIRGSVKAHA